MIYQIAYTIQYGIHHLTIDNNTMYTITITIHVIYIANM